MQYAKLINNKVDKSTLVTEKELRKRFQNISFSPVITKDILDVIEYTEVLPPVFNSDLKETASLKYGDGDIFLNDNGEYQRTLVLVEVSTNESNDRYTRKLKKVTAERDKLLKKTEYTQASDSAMISIYAPYREKLRTLLEGITDPYLIEFPVDPIEANPFLNYTIKVQKYINNTIYDLGYDSPDSIAKYLIEDNPFYEECKSLSLWIGNVWKKTYAIINEVSDGVRPKPTMEELLAELPKYA